VGDHVFTIEVVCYSRRDHQCASFSRHDCRASESERELRYAHRDLERGGLVGYWRRFEKSWRVFSKQVGGTILPAQWRGDHKHRSSSRAGISSKAPATRNAGHTEAKDFEI